MGSNDRVKQNAEVKDIDLVFLNHLAKQPAFDLVSFDLLWTYLTTSIKNDDANL